jgi:outer membrane protein assembly factor BamB
VWKEQCYFSRGEDTKTQRGDKTAVQKTELLGARGISAESSVKDIPATRQIADYLDYGKNQRSSAGLASEAYDSTVGFPGAIKGSAKMAPAQANLGQATVHGIWAYQGSKPFVDQGRLYSSMGQNARSVDPATGRVLWSKNLAAMLTPPAIANGKLFMATASGDVYVLAETDGSVLWKISIGAPVSFQPVVANGHVYVTTNQGTLFCLNTGDHRDDGWLMWGANGSHNGRR